MAQPKARFGGKRPTRCRTGRAKGCDVSMSWWWILGVATAAALNVTIAFRPVIAYALLLRFLIKAAKLAPNERADVLRVVETFPVGPWVGSGRRTVLSTLRSSRRRSSRSKVDMQANIDATERSP